MSIVRRIKISKTLNKELSDKDKEIVNFIKNIFDKLEYVCGNNTIEFVNNEDNLVYFLFETGDLHSETFWCNSKTFWDILRKKFLLDNKEIQKLVKYLLEIQLGCELGKPITTIFWE